MIFLLDFIHPATPHYNGLDTAAKIIFTKLCSGCKRPQIAFKLLPFIHL